MGNSENDIVWGTAGIARELGRSCPKVLGMLRAGLLPARQVDGRWCASKAKLRAFLVGGF